MYRIEISKKLLHTTFLNETDTCMQFKVYVHNCNHSNLRCNTLQWPRFRQILLLQNKTENNKFYLKTLEGPRLLCRHRKRSTKTKWLRTTDLTNGGRLKKGTARETKMLGKLTSKVVEIIFLFVCFCLATNCSTGATSQQEF